MKKYYVDAVIESNEGKKDFQKLIARVEVSGLNKAVDTRNEMDYFFTRQRKEEASIFFYTVDKAPTNLVLNEVVQVK